MSYTGVIKQVLARDGEVSDGMARLVGDCKERYPHPIWDRIGALDYQGAAKDLREWLLQQAVPDAVEVIWFAMWDVKTGFDLRGSTSWSRDLRIGSGGFTTTSTPAATRRRARPDARPRTAGRGSDAGPTPEGGVLELTEICLSLGFVSLAAVHALRSFGAPADIGREHQPGPSAVS